MSAASGIQRTLPLILVVEDFEELYELYSDFLAGAGFAVEGSSTGEQAIDEARRLLPDVIIMDLGLPRMNGWEAIRLLKHESATGHIPIVALTGHVQRRFADRALQAGADRVLFKPCPLKELLSEIQQVLQRDTNAHP